MPIHAYAGDLKRIYLLFLDGPVVKYIAFAADAAAGAKCFAVIRCKIRIFAGCVHLLSFPLVELFARLIGFCTRPEHSYYPIRQSLHERWSWGEKCTDGPFLESLSVLSLPHRSPRAVLWAQSSRGPDSIRPWPGRGPASSTARPWRCAST